MTQQTVNQNLPASQSSRAAMTPTTLNREGCDRMTRLLGALERTPDGRWHRPDTRSLVADDRVFLDERKAYLTAGLRRGAMREIGDAIKVMFLRFPSAANAADQELRVRVYETDLKDFPLWAIVRATSKAKGAFPPSSADLVAAVRLETAWVTDEFAKINRVLHADTYRAPDAAEKAKVAAAMADVVAKLKLNTPPEKYGRMAEVEATEPADRLRELREDGGKGITMSDRLAALYGQGRAAE